MKKIELTDQEISTLLCACSNEFNRTFKRRCEDGKNEHSTTEEPKRLAMTVLTADDVKPERKGDYMRRYGRYISKVKFKSGFVMQMETWAYTKDEARENITRYIDTCLQYTYDTIKEEPLIIEHGALTEKVKVLMSLRQYQRILSCQFRYADLRVIKEMVDVVLKLNSREIADIYNTTSCQLSERQRAIKTARKATSNLKRYEHITDGVPYQTEVFITEIKTER